MSLRFPLPWRKFVVDTRLSPDQMQASITHVISLRRVWGFAASPGGFQFKLPAGSSRRSWMVVLGNFEARPFGSQMRVMIRASLPEIVILGFGALFVPIALVGATLVHHQGFASLKGSFVFGMLIGPCSWLLLSLSHAYHSRKIEQWLRTALPSVTP